MKAALNLRCVAPAGDHCGEALMWSAAEGAIYWTDVNRFLVHRMVLATSAVETWLFDEPCVALSPTNRAGTLLLALGSRLILWQPAGDVRSEHGFRLASVPAARLNEGRSGPGGEFWVGSIGNNVGRNGETIAFAGAPGELFRITDGAPPQRCKAGLKIANTLCVSPDQRH